MRLKRVRIFGFKTFADRTEFSLEGGVVAVVGPNGCGKSNLVDAILWGLGEGNARQLRASTQQDVIFSGSAKRKGVGYAEVNLLFDNEDGELPVDTPEVLLTRRLSRSGDSEYSINRQSCRLRDIYDLLADSGLGRAGYSIVGQKEIDTALAASAEDRRGWVDEAAGVQRYRVRKVESTKRLTSAKEHLLRVADILTEIGAQREPLKEEAELAKRYKSITQTLQGVEIGLLVRDLAQAIEEVTRLESQISQSLSRIQEESKRADQLDDQVRSVGETISEIELQMDSIRSEQQSALTEMERAVAAIRLLEQKREAIDESQRMLADDGETAAARLIELAAENEAAHVEQVAELKAYEQLRADLASSGEEATRLTAELRAIESQLQSAKAAEAKRLKLLAEQNQKNAREKDIKRERAGILATLPELGKSADAAGAEFEASTAKLNIVRDARRALSSEVQALHDQDQKEAQSARSHIAERAALEGRRRGIEATIESHEGLAQGAKAVLEAAARGLLKASYLPVGQAVSTEKPLALAIETALGGSQNDLIVEAESGAKDAIEWLKANRAGRATFQPISLMKPSEPHSELRRILGQAGIVGRASELVSCEAKNRPVIEALLGRIIIAQELDIAFKFAKTHGWSRIVTLSGEVLFSGGAVTGGHQSRQSYGLVQRQADLAEIAGLLKGLESTQREYDSRSGLRSAQRAQLTEKLEAARGEIEKLTAEAEELRVYATALADEVKSTRRAEERLRNELERLGNSVVSAIEPENLEALDGQRNSILKELAGKSADTEQAEARQKEAEKRLRDAQLRAGSAERRLLSAQESEGTRQRRMENLEPERARIAVEVVRIQEAGEQAKRRKAAAELRLQDYQIQKRELLEASLRVAEEAKSARANVHAIGEANHQAELNRARADSRRATSGQRLLEEYGLNEDEGLAAQGQHEVPADAPALVSRLRREIKAMGDVNVGAIEAFDRISERFEMLTAQKEDIELGIEQVLAGMSELDALTKDKFLSTFDQLEVAFSETFVKLFGGGEGILSLSNPENVLESGIDINVTLPGKRRQPLALLSGGERSLCAMAFLFALLKVKPSPLVVLDEVDAPLDGRNVERFADLLKSFSETIQFIVITHNPSTIEHAPVWLGVTMQEPGVSTLVPTRVPLVLA